MKGEILSVGTELLLGELVDTNAPYLAGSLSQIGIDVYFISQVGDNQQRLLTALQRAWERSDLVVISGGMGPTGDDLTREAIAELLGEEMVVQPELEADLRAFFERRGRVMPERNVKQATVIPSATALRNPIGTAPGWWVERDGRVIVAMPGVPVEMHRMWQEDVLPLLGRATGGGVILSRTLKTLGIGESAAEDELRSLTGLSNPTVATYAKQDGVHVRITAKAGSDEDARRMLAEAEGRARAILGEHVYGVDQETVADVLSAQLQRLKATLATMEACTAGQLSATIGGAATQHGNFLGGLVAFDTALMERFGVDPTAVFSSGSASEEAARAMAAAARRAFASTIGLAVSCGMEGNPAGNGNQAVACCAVDDAGHLISVTNRYTTTPRDLRRRAVLDAMDLLRRRLMAAE
jgi:nicotinamide-nucleotide amidase